MNKSRVIDFTLLMLLAAGLIGALKVSINNYAGAHCPHLGIVPVCYLVLIAYTLMVLSVVVRHNGCKHYFFCVGWGVAFVIALVGSIAEIMAGGGVCPTSGSGGIRAASTGSVPLCFLSLAMLVIILVLFLIGPYKRACDCYNDDSAQTD